jgi:hypothetical protein
LILRDILDGARRLLQEQEALSRGLNDPNALAIALVNQAVLLADHSRQAEGLPLGAEALRLATQHGHRHARAQALL